LAQVRDAPRVALLVIRAHRDIAALDEVAERCWPNAPPAKSPVVAHGPDRSEPIDLRLEVGLHIEWQRLASAQHCATLLIDQHWVEHVLAVLPSSGASGPKKTLPPWALLLPFGSVRLLE